MGVERANRPPSRRSNVNATTPSDDGRRLGGRRFVVVLYLALVALSGVLGVLFTTAVEDPSPPALFFLVDLPPTAVGFGLYGALTVAVVLGVPLALVVAVSTLVDDVDAVGRADGEGGGGSDATADGGDPGPDEGPSPADVTTGPAPPNDSQKD
jgi:hypothetical protein